MSASFSPLTFTGVSSFSSDLQTILTRAVSIGSLPIKALQNEQADTLSRKQLLGDINTSVEDLAAKLTTLGEIGGNQALTASSSDTAHVTVTATGATAPGTYRITDITSLASAASEMSVAGYADSITATVSSTGQMKLVVGGNTYNLDLTGKNTLEGLRDAINASAAGVTASILTTGAGENPNYLSITANTVGATTLQLIDDPITEGNPDGANTNLLTGAHQGSNTVFKLNGVTVSKAATLINDIIPGLTFTIVSKTEGAEEINLTLSSNRSTLATALKDFAASYNALVKKLDAQVGEAAGLLSGDYLVRDIRDSLRKLVGHAGTGAVKSLAELGIEISLAGEMSLDQAAFDRLPQSRMPDLFAFVGGATTGLGAFSKTFTSFSDPVTGLIKVQQDQYDAADARLQHQIEEQSARLTDMQASMMARLQAADALLAQLEGQQAFVSASIDSLKLVMYGRNEE